MNAFSHCPEGFKIGADIKSVHSTRSETTSLPKSRMYSLYSLHDCTICMQPGELVHASEVCDRYHLPSVCRSCLSNHVHHHINRRGTEGLSCPSDGCEAQLFSTDVQSWASVEVFTRYERLSIIQVLRASQEGDVFHCPNPGCYGFQVHIGSDDQPIVKCVKCERKSCFTDNVLWHDGLTCYQYQAAREHKHLRRNEASAKHIARKTKQCPKCKAICVKGDNGCDHLKCTAPVAGLSSTSTCDHEFCWGCLAPYYNIRRYGNHYHEQKCRWYRPDGPDAVEPPPLSTFSRYLKAIKEGWKRRYMAA